MPKVSIITVCLNNKDGLQKTIDSVMKQTFSDFEHLIIDGGSTDGSVELLNIYRSKLAHAVSENDKGAYDAMNKGIKLATGEYCQFLNAGDTLFNNNTLKKVFAIGCSEDILYGNMIIELMNGKRQLGKMPPVLTVKQMIRDTLWHPVSFIKRNLFERVGMFNLQYRIAADYDFFLKVMMTEKISSHYLNQTVAVFKLDGMSSLASNQERLKEERRKIQLQYFNKEEIEDALRLNVTEKISTQLKKWIR